MPKREKKTKKLGYQQIVNRLLFDRHVSPEEAETLQRGSMQGFGARLIERLLRGDAPQISPEKLRELIKPIHAVASKYIEDLLPGADVIDPLPGGTQEDWAKMKEETKAWASLRERWKGTQKVERVRFDFTMEKGGVGSDLDLRIECGFDPLDMDSAISAASYAVTVSSMATEGTIVWLHLPEGDGGLTPFSAEIFPAEDDAPVLRILKAYADKLGW